jgi:hypothetical protein
LDPFQDCKRLLTSRLYDTFTKFTSYFAIITNKIYASKEILKKCFILQAAFKAKTELPAVRIM